MVQTVEFACYAGNLASISGSARSPGERKDYAFKWASQVAQVFLPGEFHGQRVLMGLQSMESQRVDTTDRLTQTYFVQILNFTESSPYYI